MNLIQLNWFSRLSILLIAVTAISFSSQAQGIYQNWGTTRDGGSDGIGVIFSTDSAGGNLANKHSFSFSNKGGNPIGAMIAYNSKLYGVAQIGGANNKAVIFSYDPSPSNTYTKLVDVVDPSGYTGTVSDMTEYNGDFYGTIYDGGVTNVGSLYKYTPATNTFQIIYSFSSATGQSPVGSLALYNNKLYGVTTNGGSSGNDLGVIFVYDPSNPTTPYSQLADFNDGITGPGSGTLSNPTGSLTYYNNKLYGTTTNNALGIGGGVFEYDLTLPGFTYQLELDASIGESPANFNSGLLLYNTNLYGLSYIGGANGSGILFEYNTTTHAYSSRYEFPDPGVDLTQGNGPQGGLAASGSKLIGLTYGGGGPAGLGVLFEYDEATGIFTKQVDFTGSNGASSYSTLTNYGGVLYGTTKQGGTSDLGVIFMYDPSTPTALAKKIDFGASAAANPSSSLTYYNKILYGTTQKGGANGLGTIYKYDKATGTTTVLYDFEGTQGSYPMGDLIEQGGKLYAMTIGGGLHDKGVIFSYDPAASSNPYADVYDFDGTNGGNPDISTARYNSSPLVFYNSKFYGTTHAGGVNSSGVIFEFNPTGSVYNPIFNFPAGSDPTGGLTVLNNKLYGLSTTGGANNKGLLFEFDPTNPSIITPINDFTTSDDLASNDTQLSPPGLTVANGKLYGVSFDGGDNGDGFLFEYDPAVGYAKKLDFTNLTGSAPASKLMERNGLLYGVTYSGGGTVDNAGVVYEYNPTTGDYAANSVFAPAATGAGATGTSLVSVPAPIANGASGTCVNLTPFTPSAAAGWKGIVDGASAVAEVNPNGNNLGLITPSYYVQTNPARTYNSYSFLNRSIAISVGTQPTSAVSVRLYVKKSEIDDLIASPNSSITSANDIIVFKSEATGCAGTIANDLVKLPTTVSTWEDDYVYTVSVNSFSTFHFASLNVTLPITLLDFTASRKTKGEVLLNWSTSTEINSNYFSIERGEDPAHFTAVGKLPAAGTSSIKKSYQYTDVYSSDNDVYYRLKMVDKDGTFKYSKTVKVNGAATTISVSPNPAHNTLTITGARFTQLQIIDATGRLVSQFGQASSNQYDIRNLQQGMYTLRFINGTTVTSSRFIKL